MVALWFIFDWILVVTNISDGSIDPNYPVVGFFNVSSVHGMGNTLDDDEITKHRTSAPKSFGVAEKLRYWRNQLYDTFMFNDI